MSYGKSFPSHLWLLGFLSLTGAVLFFAATAPWGIGTYPDSAAYIAGARNILKGAGYVHFRDATPITHWPPLYSLSLVVLGVFGIDPLDGARLQHTFLFGLTIFMVGIILKKLTRSTLTAFFGSWLVLTSAPMLRVYGFVCSEPLFILLTLPGLFFLSEYARGGPKTFLFYSALLTGLGCLDRYVGVTVIATGTLFLLLLHQKSILCRLRDAALYVLLSSLPLALWFLRNQLLTQNMTNRVVRLHPVSSSYLFQFMDTVSGWILPEEVPSSLRYSMLFILLAGISGVAVCAVWHTVRHQSPQLMMKGPAFRFMAILALFCLCYTGFQVLHVFFIHASVEANNRHYSPVFFAGLILILTLGHHFLQQQSRRPALRIIALTAVVSLSLLSLSRASQTFMSFYQKGYASTSRKWRTSPTIAKVTTLPPDAVLYSNEHAIVYLLTQRPASRIPRKYSTRQYRDASGAKESRQALRRMERLKSKIIAKGAYVVYFTKGHNWYKFSKPELAERLSLVPLYELEDGVIYKPAPPQELKSASQTP